jgi:serine/threonine-protein phosphatase PPG1
MWVIYLVLKCKIIYDSISVKNFLNYNNLSNIIRAHQLCMDGFQQLFNNSLTTVWSAPNYSYKCMNKASVLILNEDHEFKFKIFEQDLNNQDKKDEIIVSTKSIPEYFV